MNGEGPTYDTVTYEEFFAEYDAAYAKGDAFAELIAERDYWRQRFEVLNGLFTADEEGPAARYWKDMHLARVQERDDALALAEGRLAEAERIKAEMQARIDALYAELDTARDVITDLQERRLGTEKQDDH